MLRREAEVRCQVGPAWQRTLTLTLSAIPRLKHRVDAPLLCGEKRRALRLAAERYTRPLLAPAPVTAPHRPVNERNPIPKSLGTRVTVDSLSGAREHPPSPRRACNPVPLAAAILARSTKFSARRRASRRPEPTRQRPPGADGVYNARVYTVVDALADTMAEIDRLDLTREERIEALASKRRAGGHIIRRCCARE